MSCEQKFKDELRARGFRLTPQREEILEVLHDCHGDTTTAESVYEHVRRRDPHIDVATVYRTLELLAELGFAKCIDTGRKERLWEFLGSEEPHPHLLCRHCGELSGLDPAETEALSEHLRRHYGFTAAIGQLTIPGLCRRCRDLLPN